MLKSASRWDHTHIGDTLNHYGSQVEHSQLTSALSYVDIVSKMDRLSGEERRFAEESLVCG